MKCHACGIEADEGSVYCPKCGERIDLSEGSAPMASEPEEPQAAQAVAASEPAGAEESAGATPDSSRTPADRIRDSLKPATEGAEDEEKELWRGTYARRTMVGTWLLCGLATVVLLALGIWFSVKGWIPVGVRWGTILVALLVLWGYPALLLVYRRLSIRYRLTTQRFFHEEGILRHVTDRIEVIDMDDISFDQTILQRLVNVGTIHITSSDRSHPILDIHGIEDVEKVASLMDDARRKERIRRGLHIEAV